MKQSIMMMATFMKGHNEEFNDFLEIIYTHEANSDFGEILSRARGGGREVTINLTFEGNDENGYLWTKTGAQPTCLNPERNLFSRLHFDDNNQYDALDKDTCLDTLEEFKKEIESMARMHNTEVSSKMNSLLPNDYDPKKKISFKTFNVSKKNSIDEISDAVRRTIYGSLIIILEPLTGEWNIDFTDMTNENFKEIIEELFTCSLIDNKQKKLLRKIINQIYNNDTPVSKLIDRIYTFNKSMIRGFSISTRENKDYRQEGLICPYEHCIELFPVGDKDSKGICPMFGHQCPGGISYIKSCDKYNNSIGKEGFINHYK